MSGPDSDTPLPTTADLARFLREELGVDAATVADARWTLTTPLWVWRSKDAERASAAWYFLTIDGAVAAAIQAASHGLSSGWGSIKVAAQIGDSAWRTSIFRAKDIGGYMLPVKAQIRKAERLTEQMPVTVTLTLA